MLLRGHSWHLRGGIPLAGLRGMNMSVLGWSGGRASQADVPESMEGMDVACSGNWGLLAEGMVRKPLGCEGGRKERMRLEQWVLDKR